MSVLQMEDWAPVNRSALTQLGHLAAAVTQDTPYLDIYAMVSCTELCLTDTPILYRTYVHCDYAYIAMLTYTTSI